MAQGIYKIEHRGICVYVGCARNIRRRFNQHRYTLMRRIHRNFLLQRAWDKHGEEMQFLVIEEVNDSGHLSDREQFYIDTMKPWANISDARGSNAHTDATKSKMRGRKFTEEHRRKLSESRIGKPSGRKGIPTGRAPKSVFKKGSQPWNKGMKMGPSWNAGKKLSESHRAALSVAKMGKPRPDISERLLGRKQSRESIERRLLSYRLTINKRKESHAAE